MKLFLGDSVKMRVIPVQSRGLVRRNSDSVIEGRPGFDGGMYDLVLMTYWWNTQAMKMQVGAEIFEANLLTTAQVDGTATVL